MTSNRATTRKVVGSLAIAGAAAAVAGLGTFGTFTSSTTPVATQVTTGSVAINLAQPSGSFSIPATTTGFVPGDSLTRAVTLNNSGTAGLSSITLGSTASTANLLSSDTVNGLQLAVKSCPVPYTQGGTAAAPTYTCSGAETVLANGAAVTSLQLPGLASLNPGGSDNLVFSVTLPTSAGNSFQGLSNTLNLTFTGVQRTGSAR
jgi:spore coat-associated protein N